MGKMDCWRFNASRSTRNRESPGSTLAFSLSSLVNFGFFVTVYEGKATQAVRKEVEDLLPPPLRKNRFS